MLIHLISNSSNIMKYYYNYLLKLQLSILASAAFSNILQLYKCLYFLINLIHPKSINKKKINTEPKLFKTCTHIQYNKQIMLALGFVLANSNVKLQSVNQYQSNQINRKNITSQCSKLSPYISLIHSG